MEGNESGRAAKGEINPKRAGIVVAHRNVAKPSGGGVQLCHSEYELALHSAGYDLYTIRYDYTPSIFQRLWNRILPNVIQFVPGASLVEHIEHAIRETGAKDVFFAFSVPARISRHLRSLLPELRQFLLSHGTEAIDFAVKKNIPYGFENRRGDIVAEWTLGKLLFDQSVSRSLVDAVLTLSPFEVEVEEWLGARKALWLPRTIMEKPLDVQPINGRVGFVGTLDHIPNIEGLRILLDALKTKVPAHFRFRIVGRPAKLGKELVERYPFVEFAGELSDSELRTEASSWCCFVNPIFVNAKGCSTKLATALGWRLPIASTRFGARGYIWDEQIIPLARSAADLAELALERSSVENFHRHQSNVQAIVDITPTVDAVGARVRQFLEN